MYPLPNNSPYLKGVVVLTKYNLLSSLEKKGNMNFIKRINKQGWISFGTVILLGFRYFFPSLNNFMGNPTNQTETIIVALCGFCFGYWGIDKEK